MKKVLCLFLCFLPAFTFSSCNSAERLVNIEGERVVALSKESGDFEATVDFCEKNGYSYITYNSLNDVVLAVENAKAEFVVLNEFDFNNLGVLKESLEAVEKTDYKLDYCAYFNKNNTELCDEFNEALELFKSNGTLEKIKKGYFKKQRIDVKPAEKSKGEIIILCSGVFDDRVFFDEQGELTGFDVYFAEAICTYMGYIPVFKELEPDEMLYRLDKGEGDVVISALEYTPQRAENYLSSDSYYTKEYTVYKRAS